MSIVKTPLALLIASMGLVSQVQAAEILFDSVGDTGSILYATTRQGANLSATIGFTLSSWTTTSATFAVSIANNSTGAGTNRLTSMGIDVVSPSLATATENSGSWAASLNTVLPGFQNVNLCIWNGNSCQADAGQGLDMGGTASFNLTLTTLGDFQATGIHFTSPYSAKFQAVGTGGQSWEFAGCIVGTAGCGSGGQNEAPEPGSMLLAGLGLLGLAAARRRKAA